MRKLYKLLLIIFIGIIFTFIIYRITLKNEINIVALGDGIASGETAYDIDGLSYNDYLKDYYEKTGTLNIFNSNFSQKNYKLMELINNIKENKVDNITHLHLKQIIHEAHILTVSIGMDEIAKFSLTDKITQEYINNYISEFDDLIYMLRDLNEHNIVIVGLYKANKLKEQDVILFNSNLKNIADKYNATFIDISDLAKESKYYLRNNSFYLNYEAHQEISKMILASI